MSSIICNSKQEATWHRRYLKRVHKTNIVFKKSEFVNEVIYIIPFPECIVAGRI